MYIVEKIFAVFVLDRRLVNGNAVEKMLLRDRSLLRRNIGVVPEMPRMRVVDRYANLENLLRPQAATGAARERVGKYERMSGNPIVDIFGLAFQ